jgi:hypothetical protein
MFLKEYLYKIKASKLAAYKCGHKELIAHFLFSCRRWERHRVKLRQ